MAIIKFKNIIHYETIGVMWVYGKKAGLRFDFNTGLLSIYEKKKSNLPYQEITKQYDFKNIPKKYQKDFERVKSVRIESKI